MAKYPIKEPAHPEGIMVSGALIKIGMHRFLHIAKQLLEKSGHSQDALQSITKASALMIIYI